MNIDKDEVVRLTELYGGQWGINHSRRIMKLVSLIADGQKYNEEVVWLAAYLHDWGGYPKWAKEGVDHAVRSKQIAASFLVQRHYPAELTKLVLECIEFHHKGGEGHSIEATLIF